ncbi:MAG: rod shape-determining protein RodA [bacterium]
MVKGRQITRNLDFAYLFVVASIISISLVLIYSAVGGASSTDFKYFIRQIVWVFFGTTTFILAIIIEPALWVKYSKYIYLASTFLLLILFPLRMLGLASSRWIYIGAFNFQPSEITKISTIFLLISIFRKKKPSNIKNLIVPIILIMIPTLLIVRQPDLGSALVIPAIFMFMVFWAGTPLYITILLITIPVSISFSLLGYIKLSIFICVIFILFYILTSSKVKALFLTGINTIMGLSTPLLWHLLQQYQKKRLLAFLNPKKDPLGSGYNVIQSQIAVGSGQIWGKGFMHGTQSQLRFLPQQRTDFIFSLLCEEWGLMGAFILLSLFTYLLYKMIKFAEKTNVNEYYLMIGGVFAMFSFQIIVNVGMTIGLLPVTGVPLPLVSYGGSSMIITMFALGLPISCEFRRRMF